MNSWLICLLLGFGVIFPLLLYYADCVLDKLAEDFANQHPRDDQS